MRLPRFEYETATSLDEALAKLGGLGPGTRLVAGGTDLVLRMKLGLEEAQRLVDISKVGELRFIRKENSTIRIGALTKIADIASDKTLRRHSPILVEAAELIGSWQIRNVATIGGNLCSSSPAADTAPALLALEARLVLAGLDGEKELALAAFFDGPRRNVLRPDQILKEIVIDLPNGQSAGKYHKLMRRKAADLAMAGVAVQACLNSDGRSLDRVAIGLGGVAATPIRAVKAEQMLTGLTYDMAKEKTPAVAKAAAGETQPSDRRISDQYRRAVVEVYVRRGLTEVLKNLLWQGDRR